MSDEWRKFAILGLRSLLIAHCSLLFALPAAASSRVSRPPENVTVRHWMLRQADRFTGRPRLELRARAGRWVSRGDLRHVDLTAPQAYVMIDRHRRLVADAEQGRHDLKTRQTYFEGGRLPVRLRVR